MEMLTVGYVTRVVGNCYLHISSRVMEENLGGGVTKLEKDS